MGKGSLLGNVGGVVSREGADYYLQLGLLDTWNGGGVVSITNYELCIMYYFFKISIIIYFYLFLLLFLILLLFLFFFIFFKYIFNFFF